MLDHKTDENIFYAIVVLLEREKNINEKEIINC